MLTQFLPAGMLQVKFVPYCSKTPQEFVPEECSQVAALVRDTELTAEQLGLKLSLPEDPPSPSLPWHSLLLAPGGEQPPCPQATHATAALMGTRAKKPRNTPGFPQQREVSPRRAPSVQLGRGI